jgi:hypothetical protein
VTARRPADEGDLRQLAVVLGIGSLDTALDLVERFSERGPA